MSKYDKLWEFVRSAGEEKTVLTYDDMETILGFPIDHSFLNCKKELTAYGYKVNKISVKNRTVSFEKLP